MSSPVPAPAATAAVAIAPASPTVAAVGNGPTTTPAAAVVSPVSNSQGGSSGSGSNRADGPSTEAHPPVAGVEALAKDQQAEEQAVLSCTANASPAAKGFDSAAGVGLAGDNDVRQHNRSIAAATTTTTTAAAVAAGGAVPPASHQGSVEGKQRSNGGARPSSPPLPSTPPAIPPSAATGTPVLAEWTKYGGAMKDDSDADTTNSLLAGDPSGRGSAISSAAAVPAAVPAAAAAAGEDSSTVGGAKSLGSVPETQRSAGTAEGETNRSELIAAGEQRGSAGKDSEVGVGWVDGGGWAEVDGGEPAGRRLADWVKGGGVDDSDGDTIASG